MKRNYNSDYKRIERELDLCAEADFEPVFALEREILKDEEIDYNAFPRLDRKRVRNALRDHGEIRTYRDLLNPGERYVRVMRDGAKGIHITNLGRKGVRLVNNHLTQKGLTDKPLYKWVLY